MSKKNSKKTSKNSVSKKKTGNATISKSIAKKSKTVKKPVAKKPVAKKVVAKKKTTKPTVKKTTSKAVSKKITVKKNIPVKKAPGKVLAKKSVSGKKTKVEAASKVAVTKSASAKNQKTIFQPAKKASIVEQKHEKHIPDPPGKFELEYTIHTSTPILFEFLTTPSGLSEWFCDDVNIRDNVYSFQWDDNTQKAHLIKIIEESQVRYQWVDKNDHTYFEFRIERDDLTNDISLIVVDFADTAEDKHSSTLLWNSQIDKLLHVLGSH